MLVSVSKSCIKSPISLIRLLKLIPEGYYCIDIFSSEREKGGLSVGFRFSFYFVICILD